MGALYIRQRFHYEWNSCRGDDGLTYAFCLSLAWPKRNPSLLDTLSSIASLRHTLYGRAIGILCGYGSLLLMGFHHTPPTIGTNVDSRRIMAAALSLTLTAGLMILLRAAHPPAGATTLIISLGIVVRPLYLIIIESPAHCRWGKEL